MAADWGGLGATTWRWTSKVRRVARKVEANFPAVQANTYVAHPWPGWSRYSIDFWGAGGRGDAIDATTGDRVLEFIMALPGPPYIRHTIFEHSLWTSFGGYSYWQPGDHSGALRHVHVTYWK